MRILIVDDNHVERAGVRMLIESRRTSAGAFYGDLELLEAENGKQALEILNQEQVDILLSDIRMPFMTGLELASALRERGSDITIILLTAYGEFSYAQEAIRQRVSEYIMKPVDPEEFYEVLDRTIEKVRARKMAEEESVETRESLLRYYLQGYLLFGREEDLLRLRQIEAETAAAQQVDEISEVMLLQTDKPVFAAHLDQATDIILHRTERDPGYLITEDDTCLIFFFGRKTVNYRRIAGLISAAFEEQFNLHCYLAVSEEVKDPKDLPKICQDLETEMDSRFYLPDIRVLPAEDPDGEEMPGSVSGEKIQVILGRMRENIHAHDADELQEDADQLVLEMVREARNSQMYVRFIFSELLRELFKEMGADRSTEEVEAIEKVFRVDTIEEVREIFRQVIEEFRRNLAAGEETPQNAVHYLTNYIRYHLNEDLSADTLAEKVYLSPGYLSHLFKKETGQNLSRYIRSCRMEMAARLLLETDMKVVQIAEKAGFRNDSYFGQSFREYYGKTPETFRRERGEGET